MPTLLIRFPGGRYHATPWGHHVNEGLVEWPPSPWRKIVRALIATGYAKDQWDKIPPAGRDLIEALCSTLPMYRLPRATVAHTRHYMPTGVLDKGREKTTLVFDTWAEVQEGVLAVRWNCHIGVEASRLLARLARHIGYLGRSESWVDVEVCPDDAVTASRHRSSTTRGRGARGPRLRAGPVDGPRTGVQYLVWRSAMVEEALWDFPLPRSKKAPARLIRQQREAGEPYPVDLLDCLQKDTWWWNSFRWSQPPGSPVLYGAPPTGLALVSRWRYLRDVKTWSA